MELNVESIDKSFIALPVRVNPIEDSVLMVKVNKFYERLLGLP